MREKLQINMSEYVYLPGSKSSKPNLEIMKTLPLTLRETLAEALKTMLDREYQLANSSREMDSYEDFKSCLRRIDTVHEQLEAIGWFRVKKTPVLGKESDWAEEEGEPFSPPDSPGTAGLST